MRAIICGLLCAFSVSAFSQVLTSPPPVESLRAMAEWEEIQGLTIAWTGFPGILKQIVAAARLETQVIILTDDPSGTEDYLMSTNSGGNAFADLNNITLLEGNYNSIWMRDYAANPVYINDVDSLILVDWLYNRDRPLDDASPEIIADHLDLPLYVTSDSPYDLVYTGGNYMSDGFGTAFASELITDENDGTGDYQIYYPTHTEAEIDEIMNLYMGIENYIKMEMLPYDGIHHIDMHMKLVNEETLLVGEYPDGISDGPQINANIEYVLNNFNSKFGTPFNVVRIPMPDNVNNEYPSDGASYRTYTNAVFVNNTIIFPTYREEFDTTAYRIWGEVCPGYNLVGIDCDNQNSNIIQQSGAIHCITHSIGVADPLLISHQPLDDTFDQVNPYLINAYINHRSGINNSRVYWRLAGQVDFNQVEMTFVSDHQWTAAIPAQNAGSVIEYYIEGTSVSGKTQVRPMPAPASFWNFEVLGEVAAIEESELSVFERVYPNPASAITCIEINSILPNEGSIVLFDMAGRKVKDIYSGIIRHGNSKYFMDASELVPGVYQLVVQNGHSRDTVKLLVK